jgi:hypothetical protein
MRISFLSNDEVVDDGDDVREMEISAVDSESDWKLSTI